jgi:hypothetical protein
MGSSNIFCWTIAFISFANPVIAHNIQIAGDIAGTWHIEPNHSPKAGETGLVWVVLTRKGGKILPITEASCQMGVYSKPRKAGDSLILQPTIRAINAEGYQGIPGADIVFPKIGLYQLELNCQPKKEGDFRAFELKYDVIVTTATEIKTSQPEKKIANTTTSKEEKVERNLPMLALAGLLGLGIVGIIIQRMAGRKN